MSRQIPKDVDPAALSRAFARRIKRSRIRIVPLVIVAIVLINFVSVAIKSQNLFLLLPVAFFVFVGLRSVLAPKLKDVVQDAVDEAMATSAGNAGRKRSIPHDDHSDDHKVHRPLARPGGRDVSVVEGYPSQSRRSSNKKTQTGPKHCHSCDIRHKPDEDFCRRCGAPMWY